MQENKEERIKNLLEGIDKEFKELNYYQKAKFAINQISIWQQKFNDAKGKILKDYIVDATVPGGNISQFPEIEA